LDELSKNKFAAVTPPQGAQGGLDQQEGGSGHPGSDFQLSGIPDPTAPARSDQEILERIAADAPEIHRVVTLPDWSAPARKNLFRFLTSAFATSERYQTLVRHSTSMTLAMALFEASHYLTEVLVRQPEEFATLGTLDGTASKTLSGYLFGSPLVSEWMSPEDPVLAYIASSRASDAEKLDMLRRHFRHRAFREGSKDILGLRDVYASLAAVSSAAGDAIKTAFKLAGEPEGFSILALGRLGAHELDLLSDVDLLLVCDENGKANGATKSAEQIVRTLAAYTREGSVFPVDMRLRPRGGDGELVITSSQIRAYLMQDADAWEALVYTKLRFLAGSRPIAEQVTGAAELLFQRHANAESFLLKTREMRTKLEVAEGWERNLKTGQGGIYDIDFLTAYLLVKHGIGVKSGTLRDRLWRCHACGILERSDAAALDHAAELLRTVEHVVRLATGRRQPWISSEKHDRETTEKLNSQILNRTFPNGLQAELVTTMLKTREIYDRILAL
jgi:glutamate-ammonia-ligase adenylyltransferase